MRSPVPLVCLGLAALLAVSLAVHVEAKGDYCRALAMSGGGDKAAYEAGVLRGLLKYLPAEETSWDVVTGVSAGSCLSSAFSIFPYGQEQAAVDFALNIIADLNQSSIFKNWPGGPVEGLKKHSSVFDSTPLRNLFTSVYADKTLTKDRLVCMGMSSVGTGQFVRKCTTDFDDIEDMVDATIASAAIPGVFLDQTIDGVTYIDGGVTMNLDVIGAIEGCIQQGYPQELIIVDVIQCNGEYLDRLSGDLSKLTVLPILLRASAMRNYAHGEADYAKAVQAYPNVQFRYRILPSVSIPGSGIDFNRTAMLEMEDLGTKDAYNAINPPPLDGAITA